MKFEMEIEPLPPSRPKSWRKHTVIIACTAFVCILIVILYVRLENVTREESRRRCEPVLRDPNGPTGKPQTPKLAGTPGMETLPKEMQNLTTSQGIVEGIIAGTSEGVVIIPLDSLEQRTIVSTPTHGVAFNWQSRKVYWVQYKAGIKISNLDGSSAELIIAIAELDTSNLVGLAVDQVTGNLYYGVQGANPRIQVCDSMGKKCATVVSGVNNGHIRSNIWDIALFPSEGLMFWSCPRDKKSLSRANMDGSNSSMINLENISGLFLQESEEELYWESRKSIGHCDLNGYNRNVLLNTTTYPHDIAVDGDTLYFGGDSPNGVYSVKGNRTVSNIIANTAGPVYHVALYGRNRVPSRQNPCKNSPCKNLCVLNRVSYSCL